MPQEHVTALLSGYIDDVLDPEERAQVKKHVSACDECRAELADLKKVTALLAALPRAELPAGFLHRLRAKERAQDADAETSAAWLFRPRTAAFAMTGVLVCMVFYQRGIVRVSEMELSAQADPVLEAKARKHEAFKQDLQHAEAVASEKGVMQGLGGGGGGFTANSLGVGAGRASAGAAPTKLAAELADARSFAGFAPAPEPPAPDAAAPERAVLHPGGAMLSQREDGAIERSVVSNDELIARQLEERRGAIQEIVPQSEKPADQWDNVPNVPMNRDQAVQARRQMLRNLSRMNEQAAWAKSPLVPLSGRQTPRLIGAAKPASRPVSGAAAPAELAITAGPDSTRYIGSMPSSGGGAPAPAPKNKELEADLAQSSAPQEPPRIIRWTQEWSAATGGMGSAGGAVIKEPAHWEDLWRRIGFAKAMPEVDFKTTMAVGVFAESSVDKTRTITIVSASEEAGRLVIRYRVRTDAAAPAASSPYHIVLIEFSNLPPAFVHVE